MKTAPGAKKPIGRQIAFGAAAWTALALAAAAGWIRLGLIETLFLLAPWIVVPLAARLVSPVGDHKLSVKIWRALDWLLLPAAILATASFLLAPGMPAALLASAWLVVCALFASDGVLRLWRYRAGSFTQFCFAVGEAYLLVGASWLVISRLGLQPLGFQEPVVLLTAVHFHFAGFLSAVLAGLAHESSRTTRWSGLLRAALFGVIVGPALLGVAFLVGPKLKLAAALLIVIGQFGLAAAMLRVATTTARGLGRWMLSISAGCVAAGMALAAIWAIGEFPLHPFVNLDQMARFHGVLNAVGFGLCGLLGWAQFIGASQSSREMWQ